ncbi:glycosyl hydrolase [Aspergillus floccosus]
MYSTLATTAFLALFQSTLASLDIVPGATWTAAGTNQHIQAHGAGIIQVDGNLIDWTFENELLTLQGSGDLGPNRVVERPKVIYNEKNHQYVMWMHIDSSNYGDAKAGVAVGSSVCGDYTYLNSSRPLGYQSRDMGLFKDTDGSAYLLTEDRENGLRINKLSSNYLTVESNVYTFEADYESPAIHKSGGVYFMFASQLTDWSNFAPSGTNTYTSQTTFILDINGLVMYYASESIYMGDRWLSKDLASSKYIWLPLTISGTTASMDHNAAWTPSLQDGRWTAVSKTTKLGSKSFGTLGGSAKALSCSGCSSEIIGYIGGPNNGILTFNSVSFTGAGENTVQISYGNGDSTQRYCTVTVNGKAHVLAFLPTGGPQSLGVSVLNADFNQGSSNVIRFSAYNGQYCPDIESLVIS